MNARSAMPGSVWITPTPRMTASAPFALRLDAPVETAHARDVEAATQLGESGHRGRIRARKACTNERRRFVRWKKFLVVGEHTEVIPRDEAVGRVAIHDVDVAGVERAI